MPFHIDEPVAGIRKVGKNSVIHEVKRRYDEAPDIYVTIIDCHKWRYDSDNFFRYYAIQVMNEFLRRQGYLLRIPGFR